MSTPEQQTRAADQPTSGPEQQTVEDPAVQTPATDRGTQGHVSPTVRGTGTASTRAPDFDPADGAARPEELLDVYLRVNGSEHHVRVPGRRLLSDALRHDLQLTGTHVGCEHGVCGACTVLLDGQPVRACLMFAATAQGHEITTVEGLGSADGGLGPVQQAFVECHGLQCGFCTPGFLTTVTAYLEENPDPTPEEAREAIAGNLCRCTGYQNIVRAVCRAAELRAEAGA